MKLQTSCRIWPHFQDFEVAVKWCSRYVKETIHLLAVSDHPLAVFTAMRYRVSRQGIVPEHAVRNEAVDHDKDVVCGVAEERPSGAFS